jgi:hypothetical protein
MPRGKADTTENGQGKAVPMAPPPSDLEPSPAPDFTSTVATIGVVGVGVALFDIALIPGMIIGLAAAFAPKYVPKLGERLEPLFSTAVRGAYKATRMARGAVAEVQEKVLDIAAEVEAEEGETHAAPGAVH